MKAKTEWSIQQTYSQISPFEAVNRKIKNFKQWITFKGVIFILVFIHITYKILWVELTFSI